MFFDVGGSDPGAFRGRGFGICVPALLYLFRKPRRGSTGNFAVPVCDMGLSCDMRRGITFDSGDFRKKEKEVKFHIKYAILHS